ncbi:metallophosphoesterase [Streptomyces sp. ISL-11]|uniref:metallophosphoesterase n=1 Tax=Streptomyces sp. ISL-11 TaxID=2819174 RepID=UPI001BE875A7|nr:metallophosphoesterase [Streptomyces sp. ISL-11]MBT2383892.1 metallophosphoesterase [Streptomyces sp. ISL-11]
MNKTVVVVPDIQAPKHDQQALDAIISFIADIDPDEVIQIGDACDFEAPGRWSAGTRAEYEGSVEQEAEDLRQSFIIPVREVFDGPFGFHEGNHDLRPRRYLENRAPGLGTSDHFRMENLLRFTEHGVTRLPDFYEVAPDVITTHGHLGRIGLRQDAGATALGAAKRWGRSVVMGHTHRAAAIPWTTGIGSPRTVWGVEVGNVMREDCADYLKGAPGNWQKAFGVLHFSNGHFKPEVVYLDDGNEFVYGGYRYLQEAPDAA